MKIPIVEIGAPYDASAFASNVYTEVVGCADMKPCDNGAIPTINLYQEAGAEPTQTFLAPTSPLSASTLATSTAATPTVRVAKSTMGTKTKLGVGILIPIAFMVSLSVAVYLWRRHRKTHMKSEKGKKEAEDKEQSLYFQQKPQLEDTNRGRELESRELPFEMDEEAEIREMRGSLGGQELLGSSERKGATNPGVRHELAGEEFARELEGH